MDTEGRVGWRFLALYALGYTGVWLALLTPVVVSIALKLRQLAPTTAADDLGLVLSVGALFAIVSNPLFGHLSDRTRSRFGRRRPWLVGGMLCGVLALSMVATATHVGTVLAAWCLAQLAFNAVLAALVAVLPDQVPERQRGTVSGVMAVCLPIGQALGTVLVHGVAGSTLLTFLLPAAIGCIAVLAFAWWLPERPLATPTATVSLRASLRSFWIDPRACPDFAWACLSRFLFALGAAFITIFQPYYLIEAFGYSDEAVAGQLSRAVVVQTTMMVLCGLLAGKLSDVFQRRKVFVMLGGGLYALGLWLIAHAPSYQAFVAGIAITGAGHGMYFGTDLALVTGILRSRPLASGKDLGLLNVANTLPQSITPALGALVLARAGGDYSTLFVVAGCAACLSSLAILPVRTVR